jgi:N-acyl amino acid synthase of PEP-CTERM/exosortase system
VLPADDPERLRETLSLRYQVYCVEHGFEDPRLYPNGLEYDRFDKVSKHACIKHLPSQQLAGTVRLILADLENPGHLFPMEEHCIIQPEHQKTIANYPRCQIAEISRLAVSKQFRRRLHEAETVHGIVDAVEMQRQREEERRVVPQITLGLFQAIITMSTESQIKLWFAAMEPQLLRLLKRFGIVFTPVGPMLDYHGRRLPCLAEAAELMEGIKRMSPDVWDFITLHGNNVPG